LADLIADGLPTRVVTHQLQVEHGTGKTSPDKDQRAMQPTVSNAFRNVCIYMDVDTTETYHKSVHICTVWRPDVKCALLVCYVYLALH